MSRNSEPQRVRSLARHTAGAASLESVALLAVAALGLAGLSCLGDAMGTAVSGDGGSSEAAAPAQHAPMATSRQAGLESGAAHFAGELAKAMKGVDAETAAELARQGAAIARKEHSLGRTPIADIARSMSASDFLSLSDWIWEGIGTEGGLTAEQAHYWLGASPPKQAAPSTRGYAPADLDADATKGLAEQGAKLAVMDDAPWLRFDAAHRSAATDIQLALLRDTLAAKPFLADGIERHSLALGFFDFQRADPALAKVPFARIRRGLFFNVADGQTFDMTSVLRAVGDTVKELDGAADSTPAMRAQRAFEVQHRVAALADADARTAFEAAMPQRGMKTVQAWAYNRTSVDGALNVLSEDALSRMASVNPAYELLEDGNVAKFLVAHGFGAQALRLRETGTRIRVDAVDFGALNTALNHRGVTTRAGKHAAYYDLASKHVIVNLAHGDLASLPQLLADFVDAAVPRRP